MTRDWARSLLNRMGFVKRKATTKAKFSVEEMDKLTEQFFFDVSIHHFNFQLGPDGNKVCSCARLEHGKIGNQKNWA